MTNSRQKGLKELVCERCGKRFFRPHYRIRDTLKRNPNAKLSCSKPCQVSLARYKGGHKSHGYIIKHGMLEHRAIMEDYLGRKLERWEHVHHKNHIKTDNSIENLEILDWHTHGSLEGKLAKGIPKLSLRKLLTSALCCFCGSSFLLPYSNSKQTYCTRDCYWNSMKGKKIKHLQLYYGNFK